MNSERITFISNFKSNDIGGGWNGINSYLFNALNELKNVDYLGPINPKVNLFEKAISKSLRMIGLPGRYFFFSEKRLNKIAGSIKNFEKDSLLFFFGVTPWIKYHGTQKYVVYTDICFEDYLNIFLDRTKFKEKDLRRIVLQEKAFLKNYETNLVQLDSKKTILVFSHVHNSFDKKKLLEFTLVVSSKKMALKLA